MVAHALSLVAAHPDNTSALGEATDVHDEPFQWISEPLLVPPLPPQTSFGPLPKTAQ